MDSDSLLDYALFQLTPTRTRCDLVVVCGNKKEKVASGLVEPFISHLKYAKEQIPKGGYSITLRPPSSDSSWFTKGTLERFVRFVSTPEVLERFVTLEREIEQIEKSVSSNEISNNAVEPSEDDISENTNKAMVPFKPKGEDKDANGPVQEESAKLHLQRVLETRKAVLRKEQAMAYFRAFVAGYDMVFLEDLIAFADAFGASRLRDACMNFKELCYKKHNDGLWMDELAAMEAYAQPELPYVGTSGVVLTTESSNMSQNITQSIQNAALHNGLSNGSGDAAASESAASPPGAAVNPGQIPPTPSGYPMSWQNQPPHFMYNFPNHQMPPYQGYPFPGMHPSHYQGNMQWPPNREAYNDNSRGSSRHRNRKSSSRKNDKSHDGKESPTSEQDEHTEPSDSTSEGERDHKNSSAEQSHKRRNGKKSSRMVVIRNINYITSKRKDEEKNGESDESSLNEDEFIDSDALQQQVQDAVGSLEKHSLTPPSHKKKGGKKAVTTGNRSSVDVDQELENDSTSGVQTNENWGAFQNLLLTVDDSGHNDIEKQRTLDVRDEYFTIQRSESGPTSGTTHAVGMESEQGIKKRFVGPDSFDVTERNNGNVAGIRSVNFEEGENFSVGVKRRDYTDEELLFSRRNDDTGRNTEDRFSESATASSVIKSQRGEDWFVVNQPEKSVVVGGATEISIFDADKNSKLGDDYSERKNKNIFVDDSFMIQDRSSADLQADSQWRTDLSMVSGLTGPPPHENGVQDLAGDKSRTGFHEPDDLYMVLDRSSSMDPVATWAPEVDYAMENSFTESGKQRPSLTVDDCITDKPTTDTTPETKSNVGSEKKLAGKDMRSKPVRGSLAKSKTEIISRTKKPSTFSRVTMQKTKFETEEETRKRMEELVIERQKRIAERSAAKGLVTQASKKSPAEIKKVKPAVKDNKRISPSATQDTKKSSLQKPDRSGISKSVR